MADLDRRPLPRRQRAQTRELMLTAGMLVVDDLTARDDPEHLSRWLAHVEFDAVVATVKRLQVYLHDHGEVLPDGPARTRWIRAHREQILAYDADAYRDIAKTVAYTVFDGEDAFRAALAERLLSVDRVTDDGELVEGLEQRSVAPDAEPPPLAQVVSDLGDYEFERMRSSEATFVKLGAVQFAGSEVIRSLLRATLEDSAYGENELLEVYQRLLDGYGLRMRHGLELLDLFAVLSGLTYGMSFQHRIWPESVRDDVPWEDHPRSSISLAMEAILEKYTEPDPAAD